MFKCLLMLCLCVINTNSFAAKNEPVKISAAKDDLSDLQEKINALKKELDNNQAAHKDAADALKTSETAISSANKKLRDINKKQNKNKNTLSTLKKQSLSINESLGLQQKRLSSLLRQQYMHDNNSYTQLILQNKNPSQVARDVKYYSYIAKQHAKTIDDMQGSLVKVKVLNNKTAEALKEVAELKTKQEAEKQTLEVQQQEKSKLVKSLSKEISSQRGEIKKLTRDEKNLSNLVERLAKIIPKKLKKTKKIKSKKLNTAPIDDMSDKPDDLQIDKSEIVANVEDTPSNDYAGVNFSALKGKLRLPARGELTNRFGSKRDDTGISWKGLFIRAAGGSEVKTVATGRVVFADWMRGFGNLIIVDHGSGYMSLYGNNQAMLKNVGEEVTAGDAIASVGNSGGNDSNGVYYELRKNSAPFDPLSWSVR